MSWPAGGLITLILARGESWPGAAVIRFYSRSWSCRPGLEVGLAGREARWECRFEAGGRWWAALVVGIYRGSREE